MSKTDEMRKQRERNSRSNSNEARALAMTGHRAAAAAALEEPAEDRYPVGPSRPPPTVTVTPDPVTKSVTRKGRPPYPAGTARTRYVGILATPAEVEAWKGLAGGSLSAWVRLTLNAAVSGFKIKG